MPTIAKKIAVLWDGEEWDEEGAGRTGSVPWWMLVSGMGTGMIVDAAS